MKELIKQIAIAFQIKCSKYKDLSPELFDRLFDEAYHDCILQYKINHKDELEGIVNGENNHSETI